MRDRMEPDIDPLDLKILTSKFAEMAERCDTLEKMEKFCVSFLKKHGTKDIRDKINGVNLDSLSELYKLISDKSKSNVPQIPYDKIYDKSYGKDAYGKDVYTINSNNSTNLKIPYGISNGKNYSVREVVQSISVPDRGYGSSDPSEDLKRLADRIGEEIIRMGAVEIEQQKDMMNMSTIIRSKTLVLKKE